MKRIIFSFCIIGLYFNFAFAGDSNWVFLWKGNVDGVTTKYSYDKNSIKKISQNVWQVDIQRDDISEGDWAFESGAMFDCKTKKFKGGAATTYLSFLKKTVSADWGQSGWWPVSKYPAQKKMLNILCQNK